MDISVQSLIREAASRFRAAGIDTPGLDAEVLLSRASGLSRTQLFTRPEQQLSPDVVERFHGWVDRRARREPLAYITGEREFYGVCLEVTPAVLIPRPETEILVETALDLLRDTERPLIADIGVGSGAVAVAVAKHLPSAIVYGTDTSPEALEVARRNAMRAGVDERVHLLLGDLLSPLEDMQFDLIASNPPYIPTEEIDRLQPEVALYEPRQALDGGPDGLDCYRRLVESAPGFLKPGGALAVEVGAGQAEQVKELFLKSSFTHIRSVRDYGGVERVILGNLA